MSKWSDRTSVAYEDTFRGAKPGELEIWFSMQSNKSCFRVPEYLFKNLKQTCRCSKAETMELNFQSVIVGWLLWFLEMLFKKAGMELKMRFFFSSKNLLDV